MSTWNKHYHWKTKGCTPWTKNYFTERLVGKSISVDGVKDGVVKVDSMTDFDGDVELGNRKGKLITIYDVAVTLEWLGEGADGNVARGIIKFPEVSHENEDSQENYVFETELTSESTDNARKMYDTVRKKLVPALEAVFHGFRADLIETHAKDLGHDDANTPDEKHEAPVVDAAPVAVRSTPKSTGKVSSSATQVRVSSNLAIAQSDLWDLLTNPLRIPMWTKAPAQYSLNTGANYSLFGGNITGSIQQVDSPRKLVQTWRVPQWPPDHFGQLTTLLTQGDDSTKLEFVLSGVPVGEEDATQSGLESFYMRGLKSIGLGTML
ncbi:Co-chaperone [Malassezia vespertilionis]|uniref:Activator of Hsp90 ATPase AHSA1-like N-terminal domain-containing protein n=1 Tax=Malassezia vespertilionis TaxID=2020962 RepID=A0A2N1JBA6_9BASI|nr:Co-chaperone [Malassezia vespertilionis]PKI83824.1 hypothetical protein MVES_002197 [Malassezia vespertilionis]WFD06975.1 Co-chaperone [Malassezia vespertilionis]